MKVKSFEDLTVWQEAHKLTLEVYKLTAKFPGSEKYGVVSQLRRCSSSVPANIAEDLAGLRRGNCCAAFRLRAES
jgi:four helix bundle protein